MTLQRARILIVDDEPAVRMTLALALADTPHHVEPVESAEAALELLGTRPFDLLVVDKNLPGINGVELIRRVHAQGLDAWSVMITGYPSAESALELLHLGVRGYVEKPFADVYDVVRRVEHLLLLKREWRAPTGFTPAPVDPRALEVLVVAPAAGERAWLVACTGSGALDRVSGVESAEAALARVRARPPDLVVLDSGLRQPDPFTFMRAVRALYPGTAFAVVLEAAPSLRMLTELIDERVSAVVARPLSEATYRARLDAVLQRLRRLPPAPGAAGVGAHGGRR